MSSFNLNKYEIIFFKVLKLVRLLFLNQLWIIISTEKPISKQKALAQETANQSWCSTMDMATFALNIVIKSQQLNRKWLDELLSYYIY